MAQWLEHCVSSAKVVGSIPREHTYWQYKCIAWMHCKSLWIKASAKCINVNVVRAIIHHRGMQHPMGKFNCSSHRSTWRGQHSARGSGLHLCIYPKRLTGYTFFLSVHVYSTVYVNRTHNVCAANAMLYHWATGTLTLQHARELLCAPIMFVKTQIWNSFLCHVKINILTEVNYGCRRYVT